MKYMSKLSFTTRLLQDEITFVSWLWLGVLCISRVCMLMVCRVWPWRTAQMLWGHGEIPRRQSTWASTCLTSPMLRKSWPTAPSLSLRRRGHMCTGGYSVFPYLPPTSKSSHIDEQPWMKDRGKSTEVFYKFHSWILTSFRTTTFMYFMFNLLFCTEHKNNLQFLFCTS